MFKKSAIAVAVTIATGASNLYAGPMTSGTFTMFSSGGGTVGVDTTVTGSIGGGTWSVSSTKAFFGKNWTAHGGTTFGPGTYSFPTIQGGTYTGVQVGPNQIGGHILFDWGTTQDIDVVLVWDESCVPQATFLECTFTSTDPVVAGPSAPVNAVGPDGIRGVSMIDGAFTGFNANFDFVATFPLPGAPTFTPPANVNTTDTVDTSTPATFSVNLGTVTDENPTDATVEYSIDGGNTWVPDDGITNPVNVTLTQTVNTLSVDWRATSLGGTTTANQTVVVTIDDKVPPTIDATDAPDRTVSVNSTADQVCFGAIKATDAIEPNLTLQWSLDGFNWTNANPDTGNLTDNCSTGFGPNDNTVYWRAGDAVPNYSPTYQQSVFLQLPPGITGNACTVDIDTAGQRLVNGRFTMRQSSGSIVGDIDDTVTGYIDTSIRCLGDPTQCPTDPSPAELVTTQPFYQKLWTAKPIRLFGPGTYTFETCPLPRTFVGNDWIAADGSSSCGDATTPRPLSMTVGQGQIGAHMLFDWSVNKAIDVVVVWDVGCNKFQLTTTDPDGDGVLGTQMVDGPFQGFNAAFDINTDPGQLPIAEGGFSVTVPSAQNPVPGTSPLSLLPNDALPLTSYEPDPDAITSCVGGCYGFTTDAMLDGKDGNTPYQYVQVVLPLDTATPFYSVYRKYDANSQTWQPFVVDNRNDVKTAPLGGGKCPEPGSAAYDRPSSQALPGMIKLRGGDMCVQLTIEDGGPNDADGAVNGSVSDPGGVAEVAAPALPDPATSGGGGCTLLTTTDNGPARGGAWWLLAGLLGWLGWKGRSRRVH